MFKMAETQVACSGYFSSAYSEMALHQRLFKEVWQALRFHLHNSGDHANVHHNPAESQADPVLAEIHGKSVGEESAGHTSDREPYTVEAELGSPV